MGELEFLDLSYQASMLYCEGCETEFTKDSDFCTERGHKVRPLFGDKYGGLFVRLDSANGLIQLLNEDIEHWKKVQEESSTRPDEFYAAGRILEAQSLLGYLVKK